MLSITPPRAVRAGIATDRHHGAVVPPIHLSANFAFEGFDKPRDVRLHAQRQPDARRSSPTRSRSSRAARAPS